MSQQFSEIVQLINQSRNNALKAVNTELVNLYWNVGGYIHNQLANANWGEKTVDELADFIQINHSDLKGFNRRGLYRMKQFYETYIGNEIVSPSRSQLKENENIIVSSPRAQFKFADIKDSILAKLSWTSQNNFFKS